MSSEPMNERSEVAETYRNKHTGRKFKSPRTAHRSIFSTCMARCDIQQPFSSLKISNTTFLDKIERRGNCDNCGKSRKFFCYTCHIPLTAIRELVPHISVRFRMIFTNSLFLNLMINLLIDRISHAI